MGEKSEIMVNYSGSITALLALLSLVSTTINAESSETMRRVGGERKGLRKLYGNEHVVTDVQTECEFVVTGTPAVCVKVCVAVTSKTTEDGVIEEYSQVSQGMCTEGWEKKTTKNPSHIDGYSKNDSWKCAPESVKVSSTA